ncbi:hypothetical protein GGE65_007993 [Skermanella aerolata]
MSTKILPLHRPLPSMVIYRFALPKGPLYQKDLVGAVDHQGAEEI